jgi:uncharacterized membrane protein YeaQ/YmgE (transglycosylase-associated protein family)
MVGIAVWHFTILVPDRFTGGIIVGFVVALVGSLVTGYLLPVPGLPGANPPGLTEALWPIPGAVIGLAALYIHGSRQEARRPPSNPRPTG